MLSNTPTKKESVLGSMLTTGVRRPLSSNGR